MNTAIRVVPCFLWILFACSFFTNLNVIVSVFLKYKATNRVPLCIVKYFAHIT